MKINLKGTSAGAALVALTALGNAQVIYQQTAATDGGYASDGVAGQFFNQRMADNFTIGGAATVNTITWSGGSENFVFPDLTNFSDFVIRIYNDSAGAVGTEVWNGTFATAATNPVFSGNLNFNGGEIYDHSVATGGVALGAGSYWISIGSVNVVPSGDGYAWSSTTNVYDNLVRADRPFGSGYLSGDAADLVFGLEWCSRARDARGPRPRPCRPDRGSTTQVVDPIGTGQKSTGRPSRPVLPFNDTPEKVSQNRLYRTMN